MFYYEKLTNGYSSDSDHEDPIPHHDLPARGGRLSRLFRCRCTFITFFLLAIISATAALTLHFDLSSHHISSYIPKLHYGPNEPSTLTCGSTRLEALAKNCTLDIMADAWLPPACYNSTSASLSLDPSTILSNLTGAGIFDWYRDENHTLPLPLAQISAIDELRAYTWQVYHLAHCMYSWTTTVRAMNRVREGERDVWIDQRLLSEEHVHHCAMVLAGNGGEEGVLRGTQVEVRFTLGTCVRLDEVGKGIWKHER
jgi:hypothetical protein